MNTQEALAQLEAKSWDSLLENTDEKSVRAALNKNRHTLEDLALLLSKGAEKILEEIAVIANAITLARFGKALSLYAPLYTTSKCSGTCPYCGFKKTLKIKRTTLNLDEILQEAKIIRETGIQHLLLVSGDGKDGSSVEYICKAAKELKKIFPSISVEIPPMDTDNYLELAKAGIDGVTLYQETYNRELYNTLHAGSPKQDFNYRLLALARAGEAKIRRLNPGVLWGLSDWRKDALLLGAHAKYLEKKYWQSQILIGMPRLHKVPDDFKIPHPVNDKAFCHIIMAMRIFLKDAAIVVSTREKPEFRDNLPQLGVTQLSAGSKTEPGGYGAQNKNAPQFEIDDSRSPIMVKASLEEKGYDPVFKDWSTEFRN